VEVAGLGGAVACGTRWLLCVDDQVADSEQCVLVAGHYFHCVGVSVGECIGGQMKKDDVWFAVAVFGTLFLSVVGLVALYLHVIPALVIP
jgi:hypothetical protein